MGKVIGRFDPTPSRTPEECERHYTQVHVRMAQDLLRPMPSLLSYYTNRAVAQADVNGGWKPAAARLAVRGASLHARRDARVHGRAERDGGAGPRQLPVPAAFVRRRRDRAARPRRWSARADEVHARGRSRARCRRRQRLGRLHRAGGSGSRGGGRGVRRAAPDRQSRAERGRVRAARRRRPAADRAARGHHAGRLHRGVLRSRPLGRGSPRPAGREWRAARSRACRRQPLCGSRSSAPLD